MEAKNESLKGPKRQKILKFNFFLYTPFKTLMGPVANFESNRSWLKYHFQWKRENFSRLKCHDQDWNIMIKFKIHLDVWNFMIKSWKALEPLVPRWKNSKNISTLWSLILKNQIQNKFEAPKKLFSFGN